MIALRTYGDRRNIASKYMAYHFRTRRHKQDLANNASETDIVTSLA